MSDILRKSANMDDSNDNLLRKVLSRASENDEILRKFCKNANITLDKVPVVEVEQVSPVIVNTYSEAPIANEAKEPSQQKEPEPSSLVMDNMSRKRKRHSSEGDQGRDKKHKKQQRLLENLTKLLSADKQLNASADKPVQGYVTKEKYVRLMDKYNNLQADYSALQQRFKLTLKFLEASAVETDTDESDSDAPEDEHHEPDEQDSTQQLTSGSMQNNAISTVEGITTDQWEHLSSSKNVKQFAQTALRMLFDEETLLTSTMSGKPSFRNRSADGYQPDPKMLDVNKIGTIKVLLEQYLDEKKFLEQEKADERRLLSKYISYYIAYLKKKHKDGGDISHL